MVEWKAPDTPAATVDEVDTFERCSRCLSDLLLDELGLFLFNYKRDVPGKEKNNEIIESIK